MNVIRLVATAVLVLAGSTWIHARWLVDPSGPERDMQIEECTVEIYVPTSCGVLPLPWGP